MFAIMLPIFVTSWIYPWLHRQNDFAIPLTDILYKPSKNKFPKFPKRSDQIPPITYNIIFVFDKSSTTKKYLQFANDSPENKYARCETSLFVELLLLK